MNFTALTQRVKGWLNGKPFLICGSIAVFRFDSQTRSSNGRILLQPPEIFFSLAPRGTSGERDGERGIQ